jgi:hypothetical protein
MGVAFERAGFVVVCGRKQKASRRRPRTFVYRTIPKRQSRLPSVTDPRPPFQGDSSRGRLPRAEAHGLFCFRPSGDPKCPNLQAA